MHTGKDLASLNNAAVVREFEKTLLDGNVAKARRIAKANPDLKLAQILKIHKSHIASLLVKLQHNRTKGTL